MSMFYVVTSLILWVSLCDGHHAPDDILIKKYRQGTVNCRCIVYYEFSCCRQRAWAVIFIPGWPQLCTTPFETRAISQVLICSFKNPQVITIPRATRKTRTWDGGGVLEAWLNSLPTVADLNRVAVTINACWSKTLQSNDFSFRPPEPTVFVYCLFKDHCNACYVRGSKQTCSSFNTVNGYVMCAVNCSSSAVQCPRHKVFVTLNTMQLGFGLLHFLPLPSVTGGSFTVPLCLFLTCGYFLTWPIYAQHNPFSLLLGGNAMIEMRCDF
jgi:hypothetical protein